jgi:hypothetical protein
MAYRKRTYRKRRYNRGYSKTRRTYSRQRRNPRQRIGFRM